MAQKNVLLTVEEALGASVTAQFEMYEHYKALLEKARGPSVKETAKKGMLRWLRKAADAAHPEAMWKYGTWLSEEKDRNAEALKYFIMNKNDWNSLMRLGYFFTAGAHDIEKDLDRARNYYNEALRVSDGTYQVTMAAMECLKIALEDKALDAARSAFDKIDLAVLSNDEDKQEILVLQGRLSEAEGETQAAIKCYHKAVEYDANEGFAHARLGALLPATDAAVHARKGYDWLCEQKDWEMPDLLYQYAIVLKHGYGGVEPSARKAAELMRKAAMQGHCEACMAVFKSIDKSQVRKRHEWLHRAAEAGHATANHALYMKYRDGTSMTPANPNKAFKYLERAANLGHQRARRDLVRTYTRGLLKMPVDLAKAQSILERVSTNVDVKTKSIIAHLYVSIAERYAKEEEKWVSARETLSKGFERLPKKAHLFNRWLGHVCELEGDVDAAVGYFEKIPNNQNFLNRMKKKRFEMTLERASSQLSLTPEEMSKMMFCYVNKKRARSDVSDGNCGGGGGGGSGNDSGGGGGGEEEETGMNPGKQQCVEASSEKKNSGPPPFPFPKSMHTNAQ